MNVLVIPAFVRSRRDAAWLARCVASAAGQPLLERIVVVDDASPFPLPALGTAEVVRLDTNGGPARARNRGIERALELGARVVLFTDVDCVLEPGWAAAMVRFLDAGRFVAAGGVTRSLGTTWLDRYHDFAGSLNGRWILPERKELQYGATCNLAVRADALANVRFDERFPTAAGEDVDFCVRLREAGPIGLNPSAVVRHDFGYGGTLRGLRRFARGFARYAAADPLLHRTHPQLVGMPTEACAAADVLAPAPPLDPSAYRRGAMRDVQPRRLVPALVLLKQIARLAYRRAASRARRHAAPPAAGPAAAASLPSAPAQGREWVPPGHFYSPIPSQAEVRADEKRVFAPPPRTLPDVDLREQAQLALLHRFEPWYDEQPFPRERTSGRRYFFENPAYSYSDALFLHFMLRHARPRRVVEVGSGYSSCVTLDTNDLFLGGEVECTFVEPYPELLRSLLAPGDEERITILPTRVQDVALATFERLEANDVLFIDSTHVSKIGSDVNHLFFEVLPRLAPGVYVHVHDIFHPFEYPRSWIEEGRAWSEAYLLRSFLAFNGGYEVVLFNTFLEHFHEDYFRRRMPLCLENTGGSIWLRRKPA